MTLFRELADVSVRPAVPGDETAVTAIQLGAWRATHDAVLGEGVMERLDADVMRERWKAAIETAPGPGFAVLVALDGPELVGFAAVAPGQVMSLEVEPGHRRAGHGSRLLAAAVDRLRADGAQEVVTWVLDGDTARERFLADCGLGADGTERTLATGPRTVVERRWSAAI
ncbi:GNAT family N-acetyltransferase [Myceligenerans pegani]|uniref:GNAT family N-acetyltransferase n=1 Tax=Myceligenerans pegani TaxID=2776917 RepID=A0ABR9MU51_9MICO|nr:GNAT family N-acetyltransferase [Myceligenerans sp. TRM 65318]MBE1874675.1 GNAT family N-acetyltransferase [Myceligenerans sp. TRM 65318]MBE3016946.1 GNAT family N-acetyltransferase [Myceligenerans sp. TRM 65318]